VWRSMPDEQVGYTDRLWIGPDMLRVHIVGTGYSVLRAWNHTQSCFHGWYINLEAPWRRTPVGFDSLDHILDITVADDLSSWAYKDEDEYDWARRTHRISDDQAAAITQTAKQATRAMETRAWPFNADWSKWRPDPSWPKPALPATWRHIW
jgi:predicted RNA-binding protein associated with RNAse of E/G family